MPTHASEVRRFTKTQDTLMIPSLHAVSRLCGQRRSQNGGSVRALRLIRRNRAGLPEHKPQQDTETQRYTDRKRHYKEIVC